MMFKRLVVGFVIVAGIFSVSLSPILRLSAEGPSPLQKAMSYVPDSKEVRDSSVGFVDYQALFETRPGLTRVLSYQEWNKLKGTSDLQNGLTIAALNGVSTASRSFVQAFLRSEEMVRSVGIDPFMVDQAVDFGVPPRTGLILLGKFDPAAIKTAFAAKGFIENDLAGMGTVWCGKNGCEDGTKIDPASREIANPFGGELGRKQPIVFNAAAVYSSADYTVVKDIAAASAGKSPSLAAGPEYQAVIAAFTARGRVIQAYFTNPKFTRYLLESIPPTANRQQIDRLKTAFTPIPAYSLIALAHVVDQDNQWALVGLVYNNEADAKTAGSIIAARLENYISFVQLVRWADLVKDRGGVIEQPTVFPDATGKQWVLIIGLRGALESKEAANGLLISSGLLYKLLMDGFFRRDLGWLAIEFSKPQ